MLWQPTKRAEAARHHDYSATLPQERSELTQDPGASAIIGIDELSHLF